MKTNYKSKHEKACLKRCVLRSVLKQLRSFTALIFDGNLFQSLGADAINDLSPKVLLVILEIATFITYLPVELIFETSQFGFKDLIFSTR